MSLHIYLTCASCLCCAVLGMSLDAFRSPNDRKSYLLLRLQNGMECLLVSNLQEADGDKQLQRNVSSAALTVEVGSFEDPDTAQGLAHFLEHMIFMGSKKYPGENEYDSFVSSHGGSCNAFTEGEMTTYQFDVSTDHFAHALVYSTPQTLTASACKSSSPLHWICRTSSPIVSSRLYSPQTQCRGRF